MYVYTKKGPKKCGSDQQTRRKFEIKNKTNQNAQEFDPLVSYGWLRN